MRKQARETQKGTAEADSLLAAVEASRISHVTHLLTGLPVLHVAEYGKKSVSLNQILCIRTGFDGFNEISVDLLADLKFQRGIGLCSGLCGFL